MVHNVSDMTGSHKTQLASDAIHAIVVIVAVVCVTILSAFTNVPGEVQSGVYSAAIAYAAGRAGPVSRTRSDAQ